MTSVCVVIPTLNEGITIGKLIFSLIGLSGDLDIHLVIVDDGSNDDTIEIVEEMVRKYGHITLIERSVKLGLGTAIREGFRVALCMDPTPAYIVTMDGDLSHDPKELPSLVMAADISGPDDVLVVGSRYVEKGEIRGWSLYRKFVSGVANFLVKIMMRIPVYDCTSGFRCYSSGLVRDLFPSLESIGFEIQIETLHKAFLKGYKLVEWPIVFRERVGGESKLGWDDVLRFVNIVRRNIFFTKRSHSLRPSFSGTK